MSISSVTSWRIKQVLFKITHICHDIINHNPNVFIVFGSGRSGTTWLAESIANSTNSTLIDEPLKVENSKAIQKMGITGWGQYIPPSFSKDEWPEFYKYLYKLIRAQNFNPNQVRDFVLPLRRDFTIKFIRAHFLMPWLAQNFDLKNILYVVRNPYDTIRSQLNHTGWGKGKPMVCDEDLSVPEFTHYPNFYNSFQKHYEGRRRIEERLTVKWCLENQHVMKNCLNATWLQVDYDDLKQNATVPRQIESHFSMKPNSLSLKNALSYSSQNKSDTNRLNRQQIDNICNVLKSFKMDSMYQAP